VYDRSCAWSQAGPRGFARSPAAFPPRPKESTASRRSWLSLHRRDPDSHDADCSHARMERILPGPGWATLRLPEPSQSEGDRLTSDPATRPRRNPHVTDGYTTPSRSPILRYLTSPSPLRWTSVRIGTYRPVHLNTHGRQIRSQIGADRDRDHAGSPWHRWLGSRGSLGRRSHPHLRWRRWGGGDS